MNIDAHRESLTVLKNAAGFLRTELSATMKTRTTPRLRFHYDEVTAHGNRMMNLVNEAMQKTDKSNVDEVDNNQ